MNSWRKGLAILPVALLLAPLAVAQVSVPQQLTYVGRLSSVSGTPSTGTHSIQFAIWPGETGGTTPLWSDTLMVTVVGGLYSVTLGTTASNPLPATLFDGTVRYLEMTVDSDLLSPRQAIGSVPYSLLSGGVQGGPVNATRIALNGTPIVNAAGHPMITYNVPDGGTVSTTVSAIFCGASATTTTGQIQDSSSGTTGYRATKVLCEGICNSPTAHMCASNEMVRSVELGVPLPSQGLWYSSGTPSIDSSYPFNDCWGWTNGDFTALGSVFLGNAPGSWDGGGTGSSTPNFCQNAYALACCD